MSAANARKSVRNSSPPARDVTALSRRAKRGAKEGGARRSPGTLSPPLQFASRGKYSRGTAGFNQQQFTAKFGKTVSESVAVKGLQSGSEAPSLG
jgi:hypothetical protein